MKMKELHYAVASTILNGSSILLSRQRKTILQYSTQNNYEHK